MVGKEDCRFTSSCFILEVDKSRMVEETDDKLGLIYQVYQNDETVEKRRPPERSCVVRIDAASSGEY